MPTECFETYLKEPERRVFRHHERPLYEVDDAVLHHDVGLDDLGDHRAVVMLGVAEQSAALNLI